MSDHDAEKIHPPTPARRKRARADGRVVRSKDFVSAVLLLVGVAALKWWGHSAGLKLQQLLRDSLSQSQSLSLDFDDATRMLTDAGLAIGILLAPFLLLLLATSITSQMLQTGFLFTPQRLAPSMDALNPASGLRRMFGGRQLATLALAILKIAVLIAVTIWLVRSHGTTILNLGKLTPPAMATALFSILTTCCLWIAVTLVALSSIEYLVRWWQLEQDLRMTDQEMRDEQRDASPKPGVPRPAAARPVSAVNG